MLANAGGKDQNIEAAESRCERADGSGRPVSEQIKRFLGARIGALFQITHIVADGGDTEQPRLIVQEVGNLCGPTCSFPAIDGV